MPSKHPNHHLVWYLLVMRVCLWAFVTALCRFVFPQEHTTEKVLLHQYKMEKISQISKKPTLEGAILSHADPEASIPILIYRGEREREPSQEPKHPRFPGHRASHEHLPRLDIMIFSARNLLIELKTFTTITQSSTSPKSLPSAPNAREPAGHYLDSWLCFMEL